MRVIKQTVKPDYLGTKRIYKNKLNYKLRIQMYNLHNLASKNKLDCVARMIADPSHANSTIIHAMLVKTAFMLKPLEDFLC